MAKASVLPIHSLVYDKLISYFEKNGKDRIYVYEFYSIVERIRNTNNGVPKEFEDFLYGQCLTPNKVKAICESVTWKLRFSRQDCREIKDDLVKLGWIKVKQGYVYLVKDET